MSVDWSRYPPLPDPPVLPEWRDTPEREAYWRDACANVVDISGTKTGCWLFLAVLVVLSLLGGIFTGWQVVLMGFFTLLGFIPVLLVYFICTRVWMLIQEFRIARKYGLKYPVKPKRRDISKEIGEVLAKRPGFDEAKFRGSWPSAEEAETACRILEIARNSWYPHGKMLWPNDPLPLFFYGRSWRWGRERELDPPDIFEEDLADEFGVYDPEALEGADRTLADLVELCRSASAPRAAE